MLEISDRSRSVDRGVHRYRNTRSASVLVLASVAAGVAWGLVVAASAMIDTAMSERTIGPPPDLKKVVERIEHDGRAFAGRIIAHA